MYLEAKLYESRGYLYLRCESFILNFQRSKRCNFFFFLLSLPEMTLSHMRKENMFRSVSL